MLVPAPKVSPCLHDVDKIDESGQAFDLVAVHRANKEVCFVRLYPRRQLAPWHRLRS